jgi:hypothetical protein
MPFRILAVSALLSLAVFGILFGGLKRQDFPGKITVLRVPPPDTPVVHLTFDQRLDASALPLGHNRGYWIDGSPPEGLCSAAVTGDRIVYRWDRVEFPGLTWSLDRLEYRLQKGPELRCFSEPSALEFWGIFAGIGLGPLVLGSAVASLCALADRFRLPSSARTSS